MYFSYRKYKQFIFRQNHTWNDVNYIFVKIQNKFSIGYSRNLWIYVHNSDKIMFSDIDIYINNDIISSIINKFDEYDIIKPYDERLYRLSKKEKYDYINNIRTDFFDKMTYPMSISGGVTAFKRNVLIDCGNFDEFYGYGHEDRNMDVLLLYKNYKILKLDNVIYHLYHENVKRNNKILSDFSIKYYGCEYNKNAVTDMHEYCNHETFYLNYLINYKKNIIAISLHQKLTK